MNCQVLEIDQFSNEVMIRHLQADCSMGARVCCSTREQVKPGSALTMRRMAVTLVLLFPALTFVAVNLFTQPDGALHSLNREPNRVHAIRFGSRSRLARVIIPDNVDGEGEITEEEITKRQHSRNVHARRLHALMSDEKCNTVAKIFRLAVSRRLGPSNDPARLSGRPIKLFIICINRGLRKVKKVGIRTALASPQAAPAKQHVVPFENNHRRRALKQLSQLQVPPLLFTLHSVSLISPSVSPQLRNPSLPPLLFTPPLPQLQIPPLPSSSPASPQRQDRPPSITFPQVTSPPLLSSPTLPVTSPLPGASVLPKHLNLPSLPPLPFQIPPLPFQIPPLPCEPSSSGKSLPTP